MKALKILTCSIFCFLVQDVIAQKPKFDTITVAGGCFWCVEAAFEQIKGIHSAVSGYAGGTAATANYRAVSNGNTAHAEAVQLVYDPTILSLATLLDIFFTAHDPTQVNRQGNDVGPQYRSEIFYHSQTQKQMAENKIKEWTPKFSKPIATKISPLEKFYIAEEYHQDYARRNPYQPYIMSVSNPKVEKVRAKFPDLIKQ